MFTFREDMVGNFHCHMVPCKRKRIKLAIIQNLKFHNSLTPIWSQVNEKTNKQQTNKKKEKKKEKEIIKIENVNILKN